MTVRDNGKAHTTVSTAELAEIVDGHQYGADDGPCLEASRTKTVIRVDSFDDEQRWPRFVPAALQQGVHSSRSLPLIAPDRAVGALNLYTRKAGSFAGSEAVGEAFAAQAAITWPMPPPSSRPETWPPTSPWRWNTAT